MKVYDIKVARDKIQAYCVYRERCHFEVNRKLTSWGLIPEMIDLLINELIKFNFLNEERYARSFTRGKFRINKWGRNKIRIELKKRQVFEKCIDLAMREIDEKEYSDTIKEILQKRNIKEKELNLYKRKLKLTRYIMSKGFEYDSIIREIDASDLF